MYVEEEMKLNTIITDVPSGGVFKPISGKTMMKIVSGNVIKAVDLTDGDVYDISPTAEVEYFAKAKVILKH